MSVLTLTPGTSNSFASSYASGTEAPSTSGAAWEIKDLYTNTIVATDLTPNGWALTLASGTIVITPPAGASQGHDPDGTGRYKYYISATLAASL